MNDIKIRIFFVTWAWVHSNTNKLAYEHMRGRIHAHDTELATDTVLLTKKKEAFILNVFVIHQKSSYASFQIEGGLQFLRGD